MLWGIMASDTGDFKATSSFGCYTELLHLSPYSDCYFRAPWVALQTQKMLPNLKKVGKFPFLNKKTRSKKPLNSSFPYSKGEKRDVFPMQGSALAPWAHSIQIFHPKIFLAEVSISLNKPNGCWNESMTLEAAHQNPLCFIPTAWFCRDAGLTAVTHAFRWQSQREEIFGIKRTQGRQSEHLLTAEARTAKP